MSAVTAHPAPARRTAQISTRRGVALAGAAFVVLSVVGIASVGAGPGVPGDAAAAVHFFADRRTSILLSTALLSLANGALLVFAAQLGRVLDVRAAHPGLCVLATVAVGLLCAIGAAVSIPQAALALYGPHDVSASLTQFVREVYVSGNSLSAMPAALAVASFGLLGRATLPRWLVGATFLVAAVELATTFSLFGHGSAGPGGTGAVTALFGTLTVWVFAVSATLATHRHAN